jgi:hypothetical protein
MSAQIGADDLIELSTPRANLLRAIAGTAPVEAGTHVLISDHGVKSTQRLAIGDLGGGLVVGLWPAELKSQAEHLYGKHRATPMIETARARGWTVVPSPHIAFFNSSPSQRLYMSPSLDALEYAERWQSGDLQYVHQYPRDEVETELWPWLKERGYASNNDNATLSLFLSRQLGKRPAHMRPGLRLKRRWEPGEVRELGDARLAEAVRDDVDAILTAAGEPALPATRR